MKIRRLVCVALFAVAAVAGLHGLAQLGMSNAAAKSQRSFVIPANDGYGVADCLAQNGSACGRVVADAWCEAHSLGAATAFGPADPTDMTASINVAPPSSGRAYVITCGE